MLLLTFTKKKIDEKKERKIVWKWNS